jgi:hypothetical protein
LRVPPTPIDATKRLRPLALLCPFDRLIEEFSGIMPLAWPLIVPLAKGYERHTCAANRAPENGPNSVAITVGPERVCNYAESR